MPGGGGRLGQLNFKGVINNITINCHNTSKELSYIKENLNLNFGQSENFILFILVLFHLPSWNIVQSDGCFLSTISNSCPITGLSAILNYCPIRWLLSICDLEFLSNQRRFASPHPPPSWHRMLTSPLLQHSNMDGNNISASCCHVLLCYVAGNECEASRYWNINFWISFQYLPSTFECCSSGPVANLGFPRGKGGYQEGINVFLRLIFKRKTAWAQAGGEEGVGWDRSGCWYAPFDPSWYHNSASREFTSLSLLCHKRVFPK